MVIEFEATKDSEREPRWNVIGVIDQRLYAAVVTYRGETIRPIACERRAERNDRPMAKRPSKRIDAATELGREFFERAVPVGDGDAALLRAMRATRGKQRTPTKRLVSLRLNPEVLDVYRRTGRGWQARINRDLEKAAKRMQRAS